MSPRTATKAPSVDEPTGPKYAPLSMLNARPAREPQRPTSPPTLGEVLDRLAELDLSTGLARGALRQLRDRTAPDSPARELLDMVIGQAQPVAAGGHQAPWVARPVSSMVPGAEKRFQLEDSHRELLRRIPADPRKVSDDDARYVAELAAKLTANQGPESDRALVESVFRPIRDHHERLATRDALEAEVASLKGPLPPVGYWSEQLAPALLEEVPELHRIEAEGRVQRGIQPALEAMQSRRSQRRVDAMSELSNVQRQIADSYQDAA